MDEKDIEIFSTLIRTGNVTRAAENLFTTQSAVTKRIQRMEEDFGCSLFIRTKKGVIPTPQAETILPKLLEIAETMEAVRNYTRSSKGEIAGSLKIGVSLNFARYKLAAILKAYMKKYPRVDVGVTTGHSTRLFHDLSENRLSIAIVRGNFNWSEGDILLSTEPICLVVSQENQDKPLGELPMILRNTDASFETAQHRWLEEQRILKQHINIEVNDISTCLSMISEGIGWALLPEICLGDFTGIKKPLFFRDGSAFTRATHLLYKDSYRDLPQVDRFIQQITQ